MALRVLMISGLGRDLSGSGASWTIKMPVMISSRESIWVAAKEGNVEQLQHYFSQRRYTPHVLDGGGGTLLHKAIQGREPATYRFLLAQGTDPNMQNQTGLSAGAYLLQLPREEAKAYGMDEEDVADDMGYTPLHCAIVLPSPRARLTADFVKQHFRDISTTDRLGMVPLHWACRRGDCASVVLLLESGASLRHRDLSGSLPLHQACRSGDAATVIALLDAGADADVVDGNGCTPLFLLRRANAHLVSLLVTHGAKVNHQNPEGQTALHFAAHWNNRNLVEQLLQAGADPSIGGGYAQTPMLMAVMYNSADALRVLLAGPSGTPVQTKTDSTVWTPDIKILDPANATQIDGSFVYEARSKEDHGNPPLELTGNPIHCLADRDGRNLLYLAARYAGREVMCMLASINLRGLDPLMRDRWGRTPSDCFYHQRIYNRQPLKTEEVAWNCLRLSALRQNDIQAPRLSQVDPPVNGPSQAEEMLVHI
ncbi:Transient receptor putative cation channel subfamily A member 1 [Elasticomyces elasticus]|nr:Transient receptor putative cation channel subfamily A member 1 [Elasticomyces elasticus]